MTDTPFHNLSPDRVLDAIEHYGYMSDLRVFALNSYENRVYQVGIEGKEPIIAKFYRPNRWSQEQILEEHTFSLALAELEIPVIAPLTDDNGKTLFDYEGFQFALYPRRGGHAPDLDNLDTLYTLGQHMGRIHALGKTSNFEHRPTISTESFAIWSRDFLHNNDFIPSSLKDAYAAISSQLIEKLLRVFEKVPAETLRIHGDCHPGNILVRPDSLFIVDLDDARTGPAIQDLWMLISGDKAQQILQMSTLLEGYEEFCDFSHQELQLIEPLRTLRLMHYAGWLARRWQDPAFPQAFPWFNTERYWAEHIVELKEQMFELDSPTLNVRP